MTLTDLAPLLDAVIGTGGAAGVIVAVQNWTGVHRAVRRIQSLIVLRQGLVEVDERAAEAVSRTVQVESFRLSAKTMARHSVTSAMYLIVLFVVFFLFSPVITPPARSDPAWLSGVRGTLGGLAALGGGYAFLELKMRYDRGRLVQDWLVGRPIRPPGLGPRPGAPATGSPSPAPAHAAGASAGNASSHPAAG